MLLSLLGLIICAEISFASAVKPSVNPPTGVWIKLLINLHRPKFNCERGFGICFLVSCGFEPDGMVNEKNLCPVSGMVNERNQLVLEITENALAKYAGGAMMQNFKDKNAITIQDPYPLPEQTCRSLGISPGLTIKPGTYPILYKDQTYTVIFQL